MKFRSISVMLPRTVHCNLTKENWKPEIAANVKKAIYIIATSLKIVENAHPCQVSFAALLPQARTYRSIFIGKFHSNIQDTTAQARNTRIVMENANCAQFVQYCLV